MNESLLIRDMPDQSFGSSLVTRSRLASVASAARRKPLGAVSAVILLVLFTVAVFAPWLAPYDPYRPTRDRLESPSVSHWLGTDDLGRDLLTRSMYGARTSLFTGVGVVAISTIIGLALGGLSGYLGGWFDVILQRVLESIQALPALVIAMVLVTMIGPQSWQGIPFTALLALLVVSIPSCARVARGAAIEVSALPYIDVARSTGCSEGRIFARHVLPNILAPSIVVATVQVGSIILAEAGLSFLGVGTPPPAPSWGSMISGSARTFMREAPWLAIVPGAAITLTVFSFNFLGDAVRDLNDPRLRQ